ncbi:hypothetical protein TNCV_3309551 [Trichonephila clavipes]|nr:hypothetical protein TNCV_3309551 [Trichonephila clavipes]
MLWGGTLLVETILRQTRTPSSVLTEEWDKLPQQLLDNVVQSMDLGLESMRSSSISKSESDRATLGLPCSRMMHWQTGTDSTGFPVSSEKCIERFAVR